MTKYSCQFFFTDISVRYMFTVKITAFSQQILYTSKGLMQSTDYVSSVLSLQFSSLPNGVKQNTLTDVASSSTANLS